MLLDTTLCFLCKRKKERASQNNSSVSILFDSIISISSIQSLNDYGPAQKVL